MWQCPKCKRTYGRKNQWHSCGVWTSDDHLKGKSESLKKIYRLLEKRLLEASVRIDPSKTAINLWKTRNYATIYIQKHSIKLAFLSRTAIEDERIAKRHKVKEGLHFHMLKLDCIEDVDNKLLHWLKGIN